MELTKDNVLTPQQRWRARNKEKYSNIRKDWRARNPERVRELHYLRQYNLSLAEYNDLLQLQNGLCATCGETSEDALVVDHDHITGKVRGLLCNPCNRSLHKDSEWMLKAIAYLRTPPTAAR